MFVLAGLSRNSGMVPLQDFVLCVLNLRNLLWAL